MAYAIMGTLGWTHTWTHTWTTAGRDSQLMGCFLGTPQLNELLFLLYIKDLPNCLSNCQSRMYADDTHLAYAGFSADNIQSCVNDDLVNVSNWLIANKLTLNMTKIEFMLFGSRQRLCTLTVPPRLSINGSPIEQVTTAKSVV